MAERETPGTLTPAESELVRAVAKLSPLLQAQIAGLSGAQFKFFDIALIETKQDCQTIKEWAERERDKSKDADEAAPLDAVVRAAKAREREMGA